jgi:hypothetical protein
MVVAIAAITYGSRALSLVLLPRPGARFEAVLARIPGPIFAGLAAAMLLTGDRSFVAGRADRDPEPVVARVPGRWRRGLSPRRLGRLTARPASPGGSLTSYWA